MTTSVVALFAHAFGQNFSLPLPVRFFIFGGVSAVVLSFVMLSLFSGTAAKKQRRSLKYHKAPWLAPIAAVAKVTGIALWVLAVLAGIFGTPYVGANFNVTFFWVISFVGFTYLTAIFGNFWQAVNPYRTIVELLERWTHQPFKGIRPYPKRLSCYPALGMYFTVICLELVWPEFGTLPQTLSGLAVSYLFVTAIACLLYGKQAWFRYMDLFSVLFRVVSCVSPFVYRRWGVAFRKPFVGLLELRPTSVSLVLFVVFMLVSTTFDGLKETRQWVLGVLSWSEVAPSQLLATVTLVGITALLFGLYVLALTVSKKLVATTLSVRQLCLAFGATLVPIALGYSVAHYLLYVLVNSQIALRQLSDPFNVGWNVFGTANLQINPTPLEPQFGWYMQLGAIVGGHIVALYLTHRIAQEFYRSRKQVVRSQLPLVAVMVTYTFVGLWIISQPIYVATYVVPSYMESPAPVAPSY